MTAPRSQDDRSRLRRHALRAGTAIAVAIAAGFGGLLAATTPASAAPAPVRAVPVGTFNGPVYVTAAPGYPSLLFVVERRGVVQVLEDGVRVTPPFLDLRNIVLGSPDPGAGAEQGLLSIAFPPNYAASGFFYVYFTNANGDIEVDEFRRSAQNPRRAEPTSRRQVLVIGHRQAQNHNGGQLQFGPGGFLYLATGDGGRYQPPGEHARELHSLLGKLLRINPRPAGGQPYRIPNANPYVGGPGRDEILAYGFRNPWRFSFDLGRLALGDVGQNTYEELNFIRTPDAVGANFGWPQYEGFEFFDPTRPGADPVTFPVHTYAHDPACSVTGGYVVRDPQLPSLRGRYLFSDFCTGELRTFTPRPLPGGGFEAVNERAVELTLPGPTSFGIDASNQVYITQLSGRVSRLEPVAD